MPEDFSKKLLHEYFYKRFTEIDEEQRKLILAIRTKTGLTVLCDRLQLLEVEKQVLNGVYHELKQFF